MLKQWAAAAVLVLASQPSAGADLPAHPFIHASGRAFIHRDQIELDLSIDAIRDARRRAEAMARGLGKQLGAATAVSSGQLKNLSGAIGLQNTNSYTRAAKAPPDNGRDLLMIVTQHYQQDVDAIFKIK